MWQKNFFTGFVYSTMRVADANIIQQQFKYIPYKRPNLFGGGGTVKSAPSAEFSAQPKTAQNYAGAIIPNSENLKANFGLNFSDINFGASRISKKSFPLTKYHDNISCPCCGEKMTNFDWKESEKLAKSLSNKKGDDLTIALYTNIGEFQYSKRGLVEKLANAAPKYPDKNISELLGEVSGEYINSLRKKQKNIIHQMADELRNRKPSQKAAIMDWQDWQIDRIMNAENEGDFKNAHLIKSFISLAQKYGIHLGEKKINSYNDRLPNSKKDIDAFVVKYQRRSPYETAYELIKNTSPTVEHIIPFSKSENNKYGNLLLMCTDCNNARGNTKYNEFLSLYPEMKYNINKYFKDIEKLIQNKQGDYKLREMYKSYIRDVKRTLEEYTNGKLCRDTSRKNGRAQKYSKY